MRIGIFGGSFDPPHVGHVKVAQSAVEMLGLDQLRVIPNYTQPLKTDGPTASARDRLEMVGRAFETVPDSVVDGCEIDRGGISYTVETLRQLRAKFPDDELLLLVGADAAREFPEWKDADEIRRLATVVVLERPGVPVSPGLESLSVPPVEISATEVREALATGHNVGQLIPASVEKYISERGLYR